MNVILPDLPRNEEPKQFYGGEKKFPVLWLLHGTFGDYTDWLRKSNVELYACEKNLIVVMPSAQNTDYANWERFGVGYRAWDYLTEELMPLVYGWFPASREKKDNFIAGLSMGGRGAIMYAFAYPEKFAAMYSMSCVPQDMRNSDDGGIWGNRNRNRLENAGGLEGWLDSYQNTWDKTPEAAKCPELPKLYFACGTKDELMYDAFVKYRVWAEKCGLPAEFMEVEGYHHEWRLWEKCVQDAIERFLPRDKKYGNAF